MSPKYIDIHSHVNFAAFDSDREEVIERALESNTWVINVGTQLDTSRKAVEIAENHEQGVYAIVGVHPIHTGASYHDKKELGEEGEEFTSRGEQFDKELYRELVKKEKVVGVGECGLDYYRLDEKSIEQQKENFIAQIELANEFSKPLMLHIRNNPDNKARNAYQDSLKILKKYSKVKGNVHFFAGSLEDALAFMDFGFTVSFTGVITFTKDYDELIKKIPLDMILAETDAPYVTPVPHRGKRNEPLYVKEVIKRISEIKGVNEEQMAETVARNAKRVFGIYF